MKYLIMCEGPNEKAIIDILLQNDCLNFTEDDFAWINFLSCKTDKNFCSGSNRIKHLSGRSNNLK